jgi:hypothetical protein
MVNGVWVADAQPGYYDANGRWVRGASTGFYDAQGRWDLDRGLGAGLGRAYGGGYGQQGQGYGQQGQGYGQQGQADAYGDASIWAGAPQDLMGRVAFLDQRVRQGLSDGSLRRGEGNRALQSLATLRTQAAALPTNRRGGVNLRAETSLRAQLDAVASGLDWDRNARRSASGY